MPNVGLLRDPRFQEHLTTPNHPERPARLEAIEALLEQSGLAARMAPLATRPVAAEEVARVHALELVDLLARAQAALKEQPRVFLDPDTVMTAQTMEAASLAAGGLIDACHMVARGDLDAAFCLPRPPGHHATPTRAMGFCFYNHVAIAAADLLVLGLADRIAVVDFDVHHGNGTQDAFYREPRLLYTSTHQYPHYPMTGLLAEIGAGAGEGANLNLPLPAGCGDVQYLRCFDEVILPVVRRQRPSIILVSAGFDAHWRDPLGMEQLSGPGYRAIAERLRDLAGECGSRLVYVLEGGYDLDAIAWAARHCVDVLLDNPPADDPVGPAPSESGVSGPDIDPLLREARRLHRLTDGEDLP